MLISPSSDRRSLLGLHASSDGGVERKDHAGEARSTKCAKGGKWGAARTVMRVIGKEVPSQPVRPAPQNFEASSSSNGAWPRRIFRLASSRENHSARSTSGKSWKRPDPRGHSIEKVLLRIAAASASPSKA